MRRYSDEVRSAPRSGVGWSLLVHARMPEETQKSEPGPSGGAGDVVPPEALATEALEAAQEAVSALGAEAGAATGQADQAPSPFALPDFGQAKNADAPSSISLLADVNLNVKIELGRTRMFVEDVLRLAEGSVVELDKLAGDPVDVFVNDRHVARGEVLVLNDNFCVRISEILSPVPADAPPEGAASAQE